MLKAKREEQNLTIQDVEKGTSIRALYIEALEKGEYDKLPGTVYAKGFIKNYGNFLNLDGETLVRQFLEEVSPQTVQIKNNGDTKSESSNHNADNDSRRSKRREESKPKSDNSKFMMIAVALIVLALGGLFYRLGNSEDQTMVAENNPPATEMPSTPEIQPDSAVSAPQSIEEALPPAQTDPAPIPTVQNNNVTLQAKYTSDCWTLVTVDGVIVYEGIINAGETLEWIGNQSVDVRLGNAGAVEFISNGHNVGKIGELGDVVSHTFTR